MRPAIEQRVNEMASGGNARAAIGVLFNEGYFGTLAARKLKGYMHLREDIEVDLVEYILEKLPQWRRDDSFMRFVEGFAGKQVRHFARVNRRRELTFVSVDKVAESLDSDDLPDEETIARAVRRMDDNDLVARGFPQYQYKAVVQEAPATPEEILIRQEEEANEHARLEAFYRRHIASPLQWELWENLQADEPKTLTELGREHGVSQQRVSQALAKLRRKAQGF